MQHGSEDLMNIKSLQLFIHLCDSKSFAKTAAAMHISPSALSRQIQKLEEETHQQLFLRDNRSVELSGSRKEAITCCTKDLRGMAAIPKLRQRNGRRVKRGDTFILLGNGKL